MSDKRLERALVAARADVTQYTIWHKTNTAPVLSRGQAALPLLRIDVNALGDYVDRLSFLYFRQNKWKAWPAALERLRGNIEHAWWEKKIIYHRALHYLAPDGDRTKARMELAKAGSIGSDEADLQLLQLYVDLEFDSQPFAARIGIVDRILAIGEERANQLQYKGVKAILYLAIGDTETANLQLSDAVRVAREMEKDEPLEGYEEHLFGRLLHMLGIVRRDSALQREAAGHFQALLRDDHLTKAGKAAIYREIGDCYQHADEWDLAEEAYRSAIELGGSDLDKVHVAECLLYRGKIEAATKGIDAVERETLSGTELDDFVFAYAAIAIWSGDMDRLASAKSDLEKLTPGEPIFKERRLTLMLRIAEIQASGRISTEAKSDSTPEGGIATVSNFILLEPNIAGIGININAIINYFGRKRPKNKPK